MNSDLKLQKGKHYDEERNVLTNDTSSIETGSSTFDYLNDIISEIGMGSYQWKLFILCGFGWLADNMWWQGIAVILPKVVEKCNEQKLWSKSTKSRHSDTIAYRFCNDSTYGLILEKTV